MSVIQTLRGYLSAPRLREHRDEAGASAVEYGLLVTAIAAIILGIVFTLGGYVKGEFSRTCNTFATASGGAANTSCNG